jgi:hypothetical protein
MRKPQVSLAFLLAAPTLLTGCAGFVAGGVAAVVISQEMLDNNTYVSHLNQDVSLVWPTAKVFLAEQSLELIEIDEPARIAKAKIDGASVVVGVEAYDLEKTLMRVSATRYGVNDGEMARLIMERLHRRIEASSKG